MMTMDKIRMMVQRMLEPLRDRIIMSLARAVVNSVDDAKKMQLMKLGILSGEDKPGIERFQEYGFTSVPFSGAEAAVLFPQGNRDHGIIIAVDDRRYRLNALEEGEVALYTDEGDSIILKRGNTIEINTETADVNATDVNLNADNVKLGSGAVESVIKGDAFKVLFDAHTHPVISLGSPSGPPSIPMPPSQLSSKVKTA